MSSVNFTVAGRVRERFVRVAGFMSQEKRSAKAHRSKQELLKSKIGPHGPTPTTNVTIIDYPESAFRTISPFATPVRQLPPLKKGLKFASLEHLSFEEIEAALELRRMQLSMFETR